MEKNWTMKKWGQIPLKKGSGPNKLIKRPFFCGAFVEEVDRHNVRCVQCYRCAQTSSGGRASFRREALGRKILEPRVEIRRYKARTGREIRGLVKTDRNSVAREPSPRVRCFPGNHRGKSQCLPELDGFR